MRYFLTVLLFAILFNNQLSAKDWLNEFKPQKVFIKNIGQFQPKVECKGDVKFAYQGESETFYFTEKGVLFEFEKKSKVVKTEEEKAARKARKLLGFKTAEEFKEFERSGHRISIERDFLGCYWEGVNPNVEIKVEGKKEFYYSYTYYNQKGEKKHENEVPAFDKLTYVNAYPGIDIEYTIHPEIGVKYSLILKPGADYTKAVLVYSKSPILNEKGEIITSTKFGNVIDHKPNTFYSDNNVEVKSSYRLNGNRLSFELQNYNSLKGIVIDPWTQSPTFNTDWDCVWECERDGNGNVYIIGGVMPMQLIKYNSTGVLQWTYNTPYDTSSWLGTFATDNAGNSYVTLGSTAEIQRVSTAGAVVWNNPSPGGFSLSAEFWNISFNCDQTRLIIGGTGGTLPPLPYIYNIDMATGNVLSDVQVTGGELFPTQEVRSITACGNGKYYYLTHDSIGYIHQSLTSCVPSGSFPFHVSNGYSLGYKCEDWRVNNTGIMAIRYHGGFIYTHRGNRLDKRDFATANIIQSVTIPGGTWNSGGLGGNSVSNAGIDIDNCGNIYVGATNGVVKFNNSLVQQAVYNTSFRVYDVTVNTNGEIIACGSTGNQNSGPRSGFVQTFSASACAPIAIICCDATICQPTSKCVTDAPFNIIPTTSGGSFSGVGITNTSTGTFSPSVAGVGVHTVYYTLPCGIDSTTVTVNACTPISVCRQNNGDLTVSGGTGPYTWSQWGVTGQVCQGGIVIGGFCTGTWVNTYGWVNFGTGTTITPPAGADSVRVVDNSGTEFISWNILTIPLCSPCAFGFQSASFTNPQCGTNNGSIQTTVNGATGTVSYSWNPNVGTTGTLNNLGPGTYSVTATDAGSGCTADSSFTLTAPVGCCGFTVNQAQNNPSCTNLNGGWADVDVSPTAGFTYTYQWQPNVSSTDSAFGLSGGTYNLIINQSSGGGLQTDTIYRETFNSGGAGWTLNTGTGNNRWLINNVYAGGPCNLFGFPLFTIPNVPNQPAAITGSPNSTYLHIRATTNGSGCAAPFPPLNANFDDTEASTQYATMTNNISTLGYSNVRFRFYWLGAGNNACYGYAQFSTNNGTSWTNIGTNLFNGANWTQLSLTNPALDNQATLKFRFVWTNGSGGNDPAISIDQVEVLGDITSPGSSCSDTVTFNLTTPVCCTHTVAASIANPSCTSANGAIDVSVSGSAGPFSYSWSPGAAVTQDLSNLSSGTYFLTVTDQSNSCIVDTSFVLAAPGSPNINSVSVTPELCSGQNNASINSVSVTGGTGLLSYVYSLSSSPLVVTPIPSFPVNNLAPGTYIVSVSDINNCIDTFWVSIASGPVCCTHTVAASITNPSCTSANGAIDVSVSGSAGPFSYSWSPGAAVTQDLSNLSSGTYFLTVTDQSNGCIVDTSFVLAAPGSPNINSVSVTPELCSGQNNASINSVSVTGGTGLLSYGYSLSTSPLVVTPIPSFPVNNLAPGTYIVSVSDINNCIDTFWVSIASGPVCCTHTVAASITNPSCTSANGAIDVSVSGSAGPFSYSWSPGAAVTQDLSNLSSGTYFLTVTDQSNGCIVDTSFVLAAPGSPNISQVNVTAELCAGQNNGAVVSVTATGGTGALTYSYSPVSNPLLVTPIAAFPLNNLAPGNYIIAVSDGNLCTDTFWINIPAGPLCCNIDLTATIISPSCGASDGSINVTVTVGSGNYTFLWTGGATTEDLNSISAGNYNLTVTDVTQGCSLDTSFNVSNLNAPVISNVAVVNETCPGDNNGSIVLTVSGGVSPYNFTWSPALSNSANQSGLTPGTYAYTVSDFNNCQATGISSVNPGVAPVASISGTNPDCTGNNGSVSVTLSNPVGTYQYSLNGAAFGSSSVFNNLGAGLYEVIVQNNSGCLDTVSYTLIAPTPFVSSLNTTDISCFGENDGSITTSVSGSTPPTSYLWSNGSTSASINGLSAGTYFVTISDGSNCSAVLNASVVEPAQIILELGNEVSLCQNDYWLQSGLSGYTYLWSDGSTTADVLVTQSGNYSVTVTDAQGCTVSDNVQVNLYNPVVVTLPSDIQAFEGQNVPINAQLQGGSGNGVWSWTPEDYLSCSDCQNTISSPLDSILYTVSYTDDLGCASSDNIWILVSNTSIYVPDAFTPNGDGNNDLFNFFAIGVKQVEWRIFNRWGEKVFESFNQNVGWNGVYKDKIQPVGVYVYYINVVFENGKSEKYQGSVTLIR